MTPCSCPPDSYLLAEGYGGSIKLTHFDFDHGRLSADANPEAFKVFPFLHADRDPDHAPEPPGAAPVDPVPPTEAPEHPATPAAPVPSSQEPPAAGTWMTAQQAAVSTTINGHEALTTEWFDFVPSLRVPDAEARVLAGFVTEVENLDREAQVRVAAYIGARYL
jgi:hypothetical protein